MGKVRLKMGDDGYFVIDIETCPLDMGRFESLTGEEQRRLLNPMDSRTIAAGIRHGGKNRVFSESDERQLLRGFWQEWKAIQKGVPNAPIVGFNVLQYDLPFLVTRSFINEVPVAPFVIKNVVDLRNRISAYKYGRVRGTLKEFAKLMGLNDFGIDGSQIAGLYKNREIQKILDYLRHDLLITDEMFKRARAANILDIARW